MTYLVAEKYLSERDSIMRKIIKDNLPLTPRDNHNGDYFRSLARSIIGQQVSTHSAAKTFSRLQTVTGLDLDVIKDLTVEQAKVIGLSRQKKRYLEALSQHFLTKPEIFTHLEELSDEDVITELTKIVGIGTWTAEMFLLFTLGRPDVFSVGDRGLQQAVVNHYAAPKKQKMDQRLAKELIAGWTKADLLAIADQWRPYRSIASLYLWESLHNLPKAVESDSE